MEPNFELKILQGLGLRNLLILNEQELNQLVEQRHLALWDSLKNNKLNSIKLSRLVMHNNNVRKNFSIIW